MTETNLEEQKRKRGAPEGNSNARKHGFYSRHGREHFEKADALISDCHRILEGLTSGASLDDVVKGSKLRSMKFFDSECDDLSA